MLVKRGVLTPLPKYENCFLARTDPRDVARTESRTFLSTPKRKHSVPNPEGVPGQLGNWIDPAELKEKVGESPGLMASFRLKIN